MMAQFPCLPLWTDALLADTGHLSDAEFGRYMRMLILMWRTPGCKVPNDDTWLARHLPHTPAIEDIRAVVQEYCQTDGNFITQKRLRHEFVDRFEYGGRMSALAKRQKNKTNGASSNRTVAAEQLLPCPPSPSPSTKKESFLGESEQPQSQEKPPARSLASALPSGALACEPDSTPAEPKQVADKKPVDMSLAEINAAWRGNANGSTGFKRP